MSSPSALDGTWTPPPVRRIDLPEDAVMVQQERAYTSPIWYASR